jgi:hypothetical protein
LYCICNEARASHFNPCDASMPHAWAEGLVLIPVLVRALRGMQAGHETCTCKAERGRLLTAILCPLDWPHSLQLEFCSYVISE